MSKRVRVLVADDSPLVCEILAGVLEAPGFEVVGKAASGAEAAALTARLKPDVITMDLQMPGSDGFSGIAEIMAETPTPILVLSADREEIRGFRALSLGALDLLEKPAADTDLAAFGALLRNRLKLLASVPVIRHLRGLRSAKTSHTLHTARIELVAIAASLGGPKALSTLLRGLPLAFPVPIVVVQHMAEGFTEGLARWLAQETRLDVREARPDDRLVPGSVLFAPSGCHLTVAEGAVRLVEGPPLNGFRPSATPLFSSAAEVYGPRACGVILTGMGHDGADGLKQLRLAGGPTMAQDEASCAVFGMPRAAIEAGAVEQVLPLDRIADALLQVVR